MRIRVVAWLISCVGLFGTGSAFAQGGQGANVIPNPAPPPESVLNQSMPRVTVQIQPAIRTQKPVQPMRWMSTTFERLENAPGLYVPGSAMTAPLPVKKQNRSTVIVAFKARQHTPTLPAPVAILLALPVKLR